MAPVRRLLRGRRHRPEPEQEEDEDSSILEDPIVAKVPRLQPAQPPPGYDQQSESSLDESRDSSDQSPVPVVNSPPSRTSRLGRFTRGAAAAAPATSVTVSRSSPSVASGSKNSIHLTVKMSSSKLRQVTNSKHGRGATSSRHNIFAEDPVVHGKRSSRTTKNLREVSDDEDENEEEDEEEMDDSEDAAGEDDDDLDADGDLDMEDVTPQPAVSKRSARPAAVAANAKNKAVKSVEEKEMELAREEEEDDEEEDDEELSELESDAEGEPDDTMLQDEEMGEGAEDEEVEEEDEEEVEDDEEDELDSDDDSTPDMSKLTKRQRGSLGTDFLQLPMEPQVKKHLTAEEHAMRRAEMARRRKNLSEKRNEEEKMDTINRLLKKQAPKRRGRIPMAETAGEATPDVPLEVEKPEPTMIRWISGRDGCKVLVPEEMLGTPAARPFSSLGGKLIEEI